MKQAKRNSIYTLSIFIAILFSCFIIGCKSQTIDENTAVKVYVENTIAEEEFSNQPDSIKNHQNKIFTKYHINRKDFEIFFSSMEPDTKKWHDFFERAEKYLSELKQKKH